MPKRVEISKDFGFEASHCLPRHPGKCSRLHGHSWKLTVAISGPVNEATGFVEDYGDLKAIIETYIISKLDHQHLGYGELTTVYGSVNLIVYPAVLGPQFYPTSENLLGWVVDTLLSVTFWNTVRSPIQLERVELSETATCRATWKRADV